MDVNGKKGPPEGDPSTTNFGRTSCDLHILPSLRKWAGTSIQESLISVTKVNM